MKLNETVELRTEDQLATLARSAVYELLSLGFSYPEDEPLAHVQELSEDLPTHKVAGDYDVVAPARAVAEALGSVSRAQLEADYTELFARTVPCPPYETAYETGEFVKSRTLADIAGFYTAYRLIPAGTRERQDHIATELEFVALLARRRVFAEAGEMNEQASTALETERSFLEQHLGRWAGAFSKEITDQSPRGFYAALATLTTEFIEADLAALGLNPDRLRRPHASAESEPPCPGPG